MPGISGDRSGAEPAIEAVCADLRRVVERLDELAFDALREAVSRGERSRPELERRVVRARNALERALAILERPGRADPADPDGAG